MQEKIKILIKEALQNLEINAENVILEHPEDFANGDYSTNVAMVYAKELKKNPKEIAEQIVKELCARQDLTQISKIEAKNGFINFYLSREFFIKMICFLVTK